ncbi:hypothetical protein BC567DRAFT_224619 [Phyllosticta citribraziliensis]
MMGVFFLPGHIWLATVGPLSPRQQGLGTTGQYFEWVRMELWMRRKSFTVVSLTWFSDPLIGSGGQQTGTAPTHP